MRASKHSALGNDFIVVDSADAPDGVDWPALAVRWCGDGPGADGLIAFRRTSEHSMAMVLHNRDGSRAEMSGNGIRCLVQAASARWGHSGPRIYEVSTDAGLRTVAIDEAGSVETVASVGMGEVRPLPEPAGWAALQCDPARPVLHLSLGNPHSVVGVEDVRGVPLARLGGLVPHVNLEVVEQGPGTSEVTMRVHERGAGITAACGTGACASAWAARAWGLVAGGTVTVRMDGGDVQVRLDDPSPGSVTLVGPTRLVSEHDLVP